MVDGYLQADPSVYSCTNQSAMHAACEECTLTADKKRQRNPDLWTFFIVHACARIISDRDFQTIPHLKIMITKNALFSDHDLIA